MDWILIRNKGEIEKEALILMGASTKRDDATKIGFFGTGAKYALAVLLREQIPVKVFSGVKEVELYSEPVTLRGQQFPRLIVKYDGEIIPTSITLGVGPTWTTWMAIRELLANAVDEGLVEVIEVTDAQAPIDAGEPGTTAVTIGMTDAVRDTWKNKGELIRVEEPVLCTAKGRVFSKLADDGVCRIYKNRVLVGRFENVMSLYDYDLFEIKLNEDRRVHRYDAAPLAEPLVCENEEVMQQVLEFVSRNASRATVFERDMVRDYCKPSERWLRLVEGRALCPPDWYSHYAGMISHMNVNAIVLPACWVSTFKTSYPTRIKTIQDVVKRNVIADPVEKPQLGVRQKLNRALRIMKRLGWEVRCPVELASFADESIMGKYDPVADKILLSEKAFANMQDLMSTLFEEWAHKTSGCGDCSRGYQDFTAECIVQLIGRLCAL